MSIAFTRWYQIKYNKILEISLAKLIIDKFLIPVLILSLTLTPVILNWNYFDAQCDCTFNFVLPIGYVIMCNLIGILLGTITILIYICLGVFVRRRFKLVESSVITVKSSKRIKSVRFQTNMFFFLFFCSMPYFGVTTAEAYLEIKVTSIFSKLRSVFGGVILID